MERNQIFCATVLATLLVSYITAMHEGENSSSSSSRAKVNTGNSSIQTVEFKNPPKTAEEFFEFFDLSTVWVKYDGHSHLYVLKFRDGALFGACQFKQSETPSCCVRFENNDQYPFNENDAKKYLKWLCKLHINLCSPLFTKISFGELGPIAKLLKSRAELVNMHNDLGITPLELAVLRKQKAVIEYLLSMAAPITAQCCKEADPPIKQLLGRYPHLAVDKEIKADLKMYRSFNARADSALPMYH